MLEDGVVDALVGVSWRSPLSPELLPLLPLAAKMLRVTAALDLL